MGETEFIPLNPARGGLVSIHLGGIAVVALESSGQAVSQIINPLGPRTLVTPDSVSPGEMRESRMWEGTGHSPNVRS